MLVWKRLSLRFRESFLEDFGPNLAIFFYHLSSFRQCTTRAKTKILLIMVNINPFPANVPILHPLKTPENHRFSSVFRGYKTGTLAGNGLTSTSHFCQLNDIYVMRCAIWYHLYNLKNLKNTHGGVLFVSSNFIGFLGFEKS